MPNQRDTEAWEPSATEIVALFHQGGLVAELHRYGGGPREKPFAQQLVILHNSGEIDIIELTKQRSFSALEGSTFFRVLGLYCDVIPDIKAPASGLMECCGLLAKMAGRDGASVKPSFAFLEWCKKNHSEASSVVQEAQAGNPLALRFAGFALQALNDGNLALDLLNSNNADIQKSGVQALSGITFCSQQLAREAIDKVTAIIADSQSDEFRARAISAAFDLMGKNDCEDLGLDVMTAAAREPGPFSIHSVGDLLWHHAALFNIETLDIALNIVQKVDKHNQRTVEAIDMGLAALVRAGLSDKVAEFLSSAFAKGEFSFLDFENTASELRMSNPERLYNLIVEWLISGSFELCKNVAILVGETQTFQQSVATLGLTPVRQRLLCGKIVGFLLFKPVTCSSLLVTILRGGHEEVARFTSGLLGGFVLMNFGKAITTYLRSIDSSCPSFPWIAKALEINDKIIGSIRAVPPIRELSPSASQRNTSAWHRQEGMRAAQDEEEADSWINIFFRRSTILYGHRMIASITAANGSRDLQTIDLQEFGFEFEIPRLAFLDPLGLNLAIWRFKTEALP